MVKDEFSLLQNCIMVFIIHIVNISSNLIYCYSFGIELERLIEDGKLIFFSIVILFIYFRKKTCTRDTYNANFL